MAGRPNHGSQIGECEDDGSGGDPIERVIESGSGALLDTLIDALTLWLPRRSICLELTNHFDSLSFNRLTLSFLHYLPKNGIVPEKIFTQEKFFQF